MHIEFTLHSWGFREERTEFKNDKDGQRRGHSQTKDESNGRERKFKIELHNKLKLRFYVSLMMMSIWNKDRRQELVLVGQGMRFSGSGHSI